MCHEDGRPTNCTQMALPARELICISIMNQESEGCHVYNGRVKLRYRNFHPPNLMTL